MQSFERHGAVRRTRVWDTPVRVFHWLFALAFAGAWISTGDAYLHAHVFAGYAFGGLLLFRLLWGLVGGGHARFARFTYSPSQAWRYLRSLAGRRVAHYNGHNPAGAWAVFAMLTLAAGVAATGLAALAGQEQAGPLAGWLGFAAGNRFHAIHETLVWVLAAVVTLHLLGVVLSSLAHRENLAAGMVTGRKHARGESDVPARIGVAAMVVGAVGLGALLYFRGALTAPVDSPYRPYKGPHLASSAAWNEECGGCHLAYHPNLLPARSWQRLLSGQHDHFGEDLALDRSTLRTLAGFAAANAADRQTTEAAWNIVHTTPPPAAPLRITETVYWRRKHAHLRAAVWSQANVHGRSDCAACHRDAAAGTFRDGAMRVPQAPPLGRHAAANPPSTTLAKETGS
jgi:cytochrome b